MLIWARAGVTEQTSTHSTRSPYRISVRHLDCCVFSECCGVPSRGRSHRVASSPRGSSVCTLAELSRVVLYAGAQPPAKPWIGIELRAPAHSPRWQQSVSSSVEVCRVQAKPSGTTSAYRESGAGNSRISPRHQGEGRWRKRKWSGLSTYGVSDKGRSVGAVQQYRPRACLCPCIPVGRHAQALHTSFHLHRRSP